jgi:tryptophanyl-tRNA synthetase
MRARVLSGMRPTGALHLGHYHGALKNWVRLQHDYDSFFFVADWHALTTHYEDREVIERNVYDMVVDWIAAGLDPDLCTLFIQSRLPEHAELFALLAMGTPVGWLERVPSYKDQIGQLPGRDLATYGFLGYPLLQAADILIYKAAWVPVGEDQDAHVELTREVARRFNHLYGRSPGQQAALAAALARLPADAAAQVARLHRRFVQDGDAAAPAEGDALLARLAAAGALDEDERALLAGHLRGGGRTVLLEPQALHTETTRLPGLDGRKMSKSLDNAIGMREPPAAVEAKIRGMRTDPQRVRRADPGEPQRCPVWQFHLAYSDEPTRAWAADGCRSAAIGCLDCKQPVVDAVLREQAPWRERAEALLANPKHVHWIVEMGTERARTVARQTMKDVREAVGLAY